MSGTRYTVDSDGDVEMSIPQPIFEVIRAPELSSWDHAALIEWHREWERYVEKIRHRCTTTGETYENVVATVKGSVKRKTLKNMAMYVLKKSVDDVTDADIMSAVQARCRTLKNEFVPDVTSLFRQSLRMDLSVDDCDARVFRYYEDFNGIVEDNGLQGLIGAGSESDTGYKSRMKARCRLLVENLQPPVLKAQISRLIELERRDCKSDDVALFNLILEHAKVQQRFHRMSQDTTAKRDVKTNKQVRPPQRSSDGSSKGGASRVSAPAPTAPRGAVATPRPPRLPPQDGCLVCKGAHWLKDCPTATNAQKEAARQQYQAAKEQRAGSVRSKAVRAGATRNLVRVNGILEVAYIADTGADQCVIPSAMADSLRAVQPGLGIVPLGSPVSVTLADGSVQVCKMEVVLDLELVTIAGAVNLRAVPCLVLEGEGDEFLLGKDALKRLGIDVDQTLAQLADSTLLEDEEDEFPVGDELPGDASTPITTLDELLDRAVANGLPHEHTTAVPEMLELFPEIWRDAVSSGAAASVEPLYVRLREDAKPYRSPPRKYAPLQAEFIREYVKSLVAEGLVTKNNAARWACAVVPVRKPGSRDKFRLTIDYRPVNRLTIPIAGVMPSTATVMEVLLGKKVFARFDLTHGFWQLPLHPDCQELFSFVTLDGVYTPNRVPQGAMDSALHFQSQMQTLLAPLIPHSALVWVDDVILFAPTVTEFLVVLRKFFTIVADANLKLNMEKSSLFELEILWCGRYFSAAGVRHDPMRVDALSTLPLPATVADLQRFVFATNWLHDSLPDYARVIAPLHAKLEAEKKKIGKRNRNALQVATQWSREERDAFQDVVSLVRDSALMVHPDPDADLCVFTDASLSGFSIVVTQVRQWQFGVAVEQQDHQLVICKGGMFKDSQLNWTVIEKEAYPIVKACNDLEYLLLRPKGFRLFCDHANLIYIFAPHDELKKHVRDRLQRWAMRLCGLHYRIEHISGDDNVWADIVSRWHVREADSISVAAVRTRGRHVVPVAELSALRPLMDADFVFPTWDNIASAQAGAAREKSRLQVTLSEESGVLVAGGLPWIPTGAKDLLARIFVIAHCGPQGHRGQEAMVLALKARFYITKLEDKVAKFVRQCLLCKHVKGSRLIPRPYGPLLTPTERNEVVHWDFLSLGEGYGDSAYLLVVKDGLSHFCELFPCATPTAYVAAEALLMWAARYGIPKTLLSDQGTHFRNEMMRHMAARLKVEQNFTPVYSPWLNGTVERLNRDVLQVLRALLLEYALDYHEWPYLLPALQANLNHTAVQSLAGHSPVEVFTGLPASSALDVIVAPASETNGERVIEIGDLGDQLENLRASLHQMHREVTDAKERKRLQDMMTHKGTPVNFDVGDFVLWSRIDQRLPNNKLLGQWVGPFKVIEALPHSFKIEHLVTGRVYEVHASRLKFYADSTLNTTDELLELASSQGMVVGVSGFLEHRFNEEFERWELLVSWVGLQAIENSWEPLHTLLQDVPAKVRQYATTCGDDYFLHQLD